MKIVHVNKSDLLDTLIANRDEHRSIFLAAQEKFRERVIEALDERLRTAREGKRIDLWINLPEPEDHTAAYDTVIEMLKWEEDDTVNLDRADFRRYVENRWEWEASFAANTTSYVAH